MLSLGDSFEKISNGLSGMELTIPFPEPVMRGRIDIDRFVALTSGNSAKIFGLYPRKGFLAVGSDADIAIIDPKKRMTTQDCMYHMDWYPCEPRYVAGWREVTFSKGPLLPENAVYLAPKGSGEFIPKGTSEAGIARPIA